MFSQHQSASASLQMRNEGIQAGAFGQNSPLNADPVLGQHSSSSMTAHPTSSPVTNSSLGEAQAGKAALGFDNAGANRFQSQPFGGSRNFSNSYLNGFSQWIKGLGNQVSNWIQRPPVEIPSKRPIIGVIDTGFGAQQHGAHVLSAITGTGGEPQEADGFSNKSSVWLGQGVGESGWASSLKEFVNVAKATPHRPAIANLSFSLTQKNPDGTVSSRQSLTTQERKALQYAEENGVLVVAAAGNRGENQSTWGQASKDFDSLVVVGSAEGIYRARHSNFGSGLDILAPGQEAGRMLQGTSLAAARVTGTISDMWTANSELSAQQVKHLLKSTATDLHTPGWDAQTGAGLLNIPGAVIAAKSIPNLPSGGSRFQIPTQIYPAEAKFQAEPQAVFPSMRKPNSPNRDVEQALSQRPDEAVKQQESRQAAPISDKPKNNDEKPKSGISAADKATEKLLETARKYIGVRERGHNRGPEVEKFQQAVDGKAQGEPWCMSFAQYAIKAAESATNTKSKVFSSEHCMTVWNRSPKELRLSKPQPGSLVIWQHGNSSKGHVGIVEKVHPDGTFTTIEGNTGGGKGVNREGDGVYRRERTQNGAGNMKVVGFLKTF